MFKQALTAAAVAALCACGGGGGGSGGGFMPITSAPAQTPAKSPDPVLQAPTYTSPNCVQVEERIECDLTPSDQAIGVGVAAGQRAVFTNRTGLAVQITETSAFTGERKYWSEYCVYIDWVHTGQAPANKGEVGCAAKNVNEDYVPIHWGAGTGLVIQPGQEVYLNSHTEPSSIIHIYTLRVQYLDAGTGVQSWRQPQQDQVIPCDGQMQSTAMSPWRNDTGRTLYLGGGSIYSETPQSVTPNTVSAACIYVLTADAAQKYVNCDGALKTKGAINFQPVPVEPGEYIVAQATNACPAGGHWNWAAFLNVK